MIHLLLLAGESRRFREAGYAQHKALLPMPDGAAMLSWVIDSLSPSKLIAVAMVDDVKALSSALRHAGAHRLFECHVVWLTARTRGPLASALAARKYLATDDDLIVSYCDCFLARDGARDFYMRAQAHIEADAGVVGFRSEDERFGRDPVMKEFALGGITWFRSAREFVRYAEKLVEQPEYGPCHVPFFFPHWFIYDGTRDYIDLGTPQDYERFMAEAVRA